MSKAESKTQEFSWDVVLPERRRSSMGAPAPKAQVLCDDQQQGGTEFFDIPLCVGRYLRRSKNSHQIDPVNRQELLQEIDTASTRVAHERMIRMLERRDHSCKEVVQKLVRDGFSKRLAYDTVHAGKEARLLDDRRFAESFVRSKVYAGWGVRRIEQALSTKGVVAQELEGWPYSFVDVDSEYERAFEAVRRKRVREPNRFAKLVRFLVNRGYSYDVSSRAARAVLSEDE